MKIKYPYNKPQSPTPINSNSLFLFVWVFFFILEYFRYLKLDPSSQGC